MIFAIYIHNTPAYYLEQVGPVVAKRIQARLDAPAFGELDALYVSLQTTSDFPTGLKKRSLKVRRDYTRKLMTGGSTYYNCVVEYEGLVALAEVMEIQTEEAMATYITSLLSKIFPSLVKDVAVENLEQLRGAVCDPV